MQDAAYSQARLMTVLQSRLFTPLTQSIRAYCHQLPRQQAQPQPAQLQQRCQTYATMAYAALAKQMQIARRTAREHRAAIRRHATLAKRATTVRMTAALVQE